jgi:hypothetical protein
MSARNPDAGGVLPARREHRARQDVDPGCGGVALDLGAVVAIRQLDPQHEPAFRTIDARARREQPHDFLPRRLDGAEQRGAKPLEMRIERTRLEELGHRQLRERRPRDIGQPLEPLELGAPPAGMRPSEIEPGRDVVRQRAALHDDVVRVEGLEGARPLAAEQQIAEGVGLDDCHAA